MRRRCALFSVVLDERYGTPQADAFCDALRLFKLGYSWGGPISLVVPYDLAAMRLKWPAHLARGTVIRFSIGLEDVCRPARRSAAGTVRAARGLKKNPNC